MGDLERGIQGLWGEGCRDSRQVNDWGHWAGEAESTQVQTPIVKLGCPSDRK